MPVSVQVGSDTIEFPDGLDESKMLEVVRKHHRSQPQTEESLSSQAEKDTADDPSYELAQPDKHPLLMRGFDTAVDTVRGTLEGNPMLGVHNLIRSALPKPVNSAIDTVGEFAQKPIVALQDKLGVGAQTMADAFDVLNLQPKYNIRTGKWESDDGRNLQEAMGDLPTRKPSTTEKILSGTQQGIIGGIEGLETPVGIATMGAGIPAVANRIPAVANKVIGTLFSKQMIEAFPEQYQEFVKAAKTGDVEGMTKAATGAGLNAAFVHQTIKHLVGDPAAKAGDFELMKDTESGVSEETLNRLRKEAKRTDKPSPTTPVEAASNEVDRFLSQPDQDVIDYTVKNPKFQGHGLLAGLPLSEAEVPILKEKLASINEAGMKAFSDFMVAEQAGASPETLKTLTDAQRANGAKASWLNGVIEGANKDPKSPHYEAYLAGEDMKGKPQGQKPSESKPIAKFGGYQFGGTVPQWEILDKTTGRTRHVSAETAIKEGFEPEKAPEKPVDSKGRTPERQKLLSDMAAKVKEATATEGALPAKSSAQALGITPGGQAVIKAAGQMLKSLRSKLGNSWATRGNKSDIARTKDAADNQAKIFASQQGRAVKLEATKTFGPVTDQALKAIVPMIESGGDRAKLSHFVTQASGKHFEAMRAARFALRNFNRLQPLAVKVKALHDAQIAEENANGINTTFRENYIKHAFDVDKLPNRGEEFFGGAAGAGTKSGFKAARKFETIYDAIEAGYGGAIKSLDSAKLTESRIASGQQLINDRQWVNSFRGTTDPTTKKPLISDVTFDKNHFPIAPPGYDAVTVLPGQFVAIHNGYRGIFDAVTGGSKLAQGEVGGLPVGKAVLNTAAGIKHGLLLFDTFHASRIMQKQFFLTGKVGYGKGLSLLDYNASDLAEAVHQGEITQEMADYARTNKPTAQLLLKEGLNVGRIQEALRSDIIRNLPVVGTFNKWVFDKVTRGAMMESALHEFDRTKAQDPTIPDRKVAATVAKKINITFGNIGRQGLLRSRTMQDVSRMAMLAPQWVESMARSEIGGILELGKVPIDLAAGRGLQVGTLGKTMAGGLLAYIAGTQLLNLATRGHLTFQNEEEGHKLDAWIPDLSGKTPGYFLNPLAVVAELTHDAYRYAFKKDDAVSIAVQIARNKASPMARSVGTLWNGKDYKGEKIAGSWNKIAAAGAALAPTPIPVAGFRSDQPGQAQRQITASLGVKTEPAPGPRQQLGELHSKWMANNPDPKLRHDFERRQKEEFVLDYKPLDIALRSGDEKGAADALATLRKTHSDKAIFARMRPTDNNGAEKPLFQGGHETEMKFRRTLTQNQKDLYDRARTERKKTFETFRKVWINRP